MALLCVMRWRDLSMSSSEVELTFTVIFALQYSTVPASFFRLFLLVYTVLYVLYVGYVGYTCARSGPTTESESCSQQTRGKNPSSSGWRQHTQHIPDLTTVRTTFHLTLYSVQKLSQQYNCHDFCVSLHNITATFHSTVAINASTRMHSIP